MKPSELQQLEMIERKGKVSSLELHENALGNDNGFLESKIKSYCERTWNATPCSDGCTQTSDSDVDGLNKKS